MSTEQWLKWYHNLDKNKKRELNRKKYLRFKDKQQEYLKNRKLFRAEGAEKEYQSWLVVLRDL